MILLYMFIAFVLWIAWVYVTFAVILRPGLVYDRPVLLPFSVLGHCLGLVVAYLALATLGPTIQWQSLFFVPVLYWPVWAVVAAWSIPFLFLEISGRAGRARSSQKILQYFEVGLFTAIPALAPIFLTYYDVLLRSAGLAYVFLP
jgi:hypothetical protein